MEETKSSVVPGHPAGCRCMNCANENFCRMCGFGRSYIALRIILALVIVGMVFYLGVKVGEFKAEIRADFGGWDNMRGNRTMMLHMRNGNGMMQEDRFYMQAPQGGTTQRGMMQQGVPGSQSAPFPPQQ